MGIIVIKYRVRYILKILILVLIILSAGLYLVISGWSVNLSDIKYFIFLILLWLFTFVIQSDKSRIEAGNSCLKIKWVNWFREVIVPDNEIERIILAQRFISICRTGKKPLQMLLESLEKEEKTRIYEFLIIYSNGKNIALERQPGI